MIDEIFNECFQFSLAGESSHKIMSHVLEKVVAKFDIKYGFIGEKFKNEENVTYFRYHAIYGFDNFPEYMHSYIKNKYVDFFSENCDSLHYKILKTGTPYVCNEVVNSRCGRPFPEGHPIIDKFAVFPLKYKDDIIGTIGLSRDESFDDSFVRLFTPYVQMISNVLISIQKAEDLEQHKTSFMANMSHELRTPLNGIVCMSRLLQKTGLSAEQDEFLAIINHCSIQLLGLVNDILDYSKIKSGTMKLHLNPASFISCIKNIITIMIPKARDKGIMFTHNISPEVPDMVVTDSSRISQVLLNILTNAIKFTKKGSVDLSIQLANQNMTHHEVHICIQDTGIGIPEDRIPYVFDSFRQVGKDYLMDSIGVGLGLPITRHIVSLFNGKIWITSKLGVGTTVNITLEIKIYQSIVPPIQLKEYYIDKNVLVICSISDERKCIFESLVSMGIRPIMASSIDDARLYLDNQGFDFNFLIIEYELLHKQSLPNTPFPSIYIVDKNKDTGSNICDAVLTRPINNDKMLDVYSKIYTLNKYRTIPEEPLSVTEPEECVCNNSKINILVAEDNISNQQVMIKLLNNLGYYDIEIAHDGLEAYVKLFNENQTYDIAFIDLKMPIMDGITVAHKFVQCKKNTQLVAVTASVSESIKDKCLKAGMIGYITKPIELHELESIMNVIVRKKLANNFG